MVLLEEIPTFPASARQALEQGYGIASAEAFYERAVLNPGGLQEILNLGPVELDELRLRVEGHLSPQFVARCRRALPRHPRGALIP